MAGGRAERTNDLHIDDDGLGNPTEEGQVRHVGGDLVAFLGGVVKSLTSGVGGSGITAAQHNALRQLIHFIDGGPADGFASGAYSESIYSGALETSETWYDDDTKAKKLVELEITYSGVFPATETWKSYAADGVTVLITLVDTITYSGAFEANRDRTWS
jgi:hypothetical protein